MKFSVSAFALMLSSTSMSLKSTPPTSIGVSAFAPKSMFHIRKRPINQINTYLLSTAEAPSDVDSNADSDSELAPGSPPVLDARNDLLSTSYSLTSSSPTGIFLSLPQDRKKFIKAVARLEAIAPTTSDLSEPTMIGDWTLVATSRKTLLDNVDTEAKADIGAKNGKKNGKSKLQLPKLPHKIKDSIKVTQRIRCMDDPTSTTIDRIDNVIEFDNESTLLPDVLNPLKINQSKVALVHDAKVQSFVPFRTKLSLKSVVLNLAGQSKNLDPEGADVFGLNVPSLTDWMNSGEFDTTYVDEDVRVSRGTIGFLEETRLFVKKGFVLDDFSKDLDADMDAETEQDVMEDTDSDSTEMKKTDPKERFEKLSTALGEVTNAVTGLTNDVRNTIEDEINVLKDDIKTVVENDLKEVEEAVGKVKSVIIGDEEIEVAVDKTVSAVQELGKDVKETIGGAAEDLKTKVDKDVKEIQDAVDDVRGAVLKDKEKVEGDDEDVATEEEADEVEDILEGFEASSDEPEATSEKEEKEEKK